MSGDVRDLVINLLASVVAGAAVWVAQWLLHRRRAARRLAFFGLRPGERCLLVAPRHASSPRENSVHRRDVAALVELGAAARQCGARPDLVAAAGPVEGLGRLTEFCVGGWTVNPRVAVHLAAVLPGVRTAPGGQGGDAIMFSVGAVSYRPVLGRVEHALLARVIVPGASRPLFLLVGQTSWANLAAARHLATRDRQLYRAYGSDRSFCLVLRVAESDAYGPDLVEVTDVTSLAFTAAATTVPAPRAPGEAPEPAGPEPAGPDPVGGGVTRPMG